jgi:hypothetical protein
MAHGKPASVPDDGSERGILTPSDDGYVFDAAVLAANAEIDEQISADPLGSWNTYRSLVLRALDEPDVPTLVTRSP